MSLVDTLPAEIKETITPAEYEHLVEALNHVQMTLAVEDQGWRQLTGALRDEEEGPSLSQLKDWSKLTRELVAASPLMKRAVTLRHSYVWSKPLEIPGVEESTGKRGRPSKLSSFVKNRVNQATLLAPAAHIEAESSLATDGCFLVLGDNKTKTIRSIPLREIEDVMVNPDHSDEIWAYLRKWNSYQPGGKDEVRYEWIFTDQYTGKIPSKVGETKHPVATDKRMIDMWVNRQIGWRYGVPDALPAIQYVRMYSELLYNGKVMTDALATFAAKVKVKSRKGSDNVGVKTALGGPGKVTTYGEGNEVDVFTSAGKTYNFDGIRPVAAMVAAAMEVSIVHLLSDPGAAGSSYGSAANLDLPTKRAMVARQNAWTTFIERVIEWGTEEKLNISFPPLEEPDLYRAVQAATLVWNSGLVHADEARNAFLSAMGLVPTHDTAPEGVLVPNNEDSIQRSDIDTDSIDGTAGRTNSAASPDQGRSNGAGRVDDNLKHDLPADGQ